MQDLINHFKNGNLHHFYILEGNKENLTAEIRDFFNKNLNSRPYFEKNFDRLLIDDARDLISKSIIKTMAGDKMIFSISLNSITDEAQNALLKVIEEPTERTYFFMIVPNSNIFLPTVLSRAIVIKNQRSNIKNEKLESKDRKNNDPNEIVKKIISQTPGERMKTIETIAQDISDEKIEKHFAKEIVEGLINEFRVKDLSKTKCLMEIRRYLDSTGTPIKMLLERAILML